MAALAVILAIGLLAWLQSLLYRKRWSKNTVLALSFSERYATEGDKLFLTEVISNRKFLPLPWLAVKFQVSRYLLFADGGNAKVSDDYYRNDFFNLMMFQRITRRLPFTCGKRGYYTVKSADLVSGDILAREKYTLSVPCRASLTVFPRVIDLDALLAVHRQFLGQILTKRFIQPDPFEFKGIREYQPTDSLRAVNFKATAKTGALMVNCYDYTVSQEIVLVLNLQKYSAFPNEALYEQTIRLATSLAAYYINQAVPLSFACNAGSVTEDGAAWLDSGSGAGHLANINDALARIDLKKAMVSTGRELLLRAAENQEMKRREGREPAYILLSTYHERDLADAYHALVEAGADALWIIPTTHDIDITVPLSQWVVRAQLG